MSSREKFYPRGKLNKSDEGALEIRLSIKQGTVVVEFGSMVSWIGFGPSEARAFAQMLVDKARDAES